jgi:hypothetical protein
MKGGLACLFYSTLSVIAFAGFFIHRAPGRLKLMPVWLMMAKWLSPIWMAQSFEKADFSGKITSRLITLREVSYATRTQ